MNVATSNLALMGTLGAPFGIKGWIHVYSTTEKTNGIFAYSEWWLGSTADWSCYRLADARLQGSHAVAKLDTIDSREDAIRLRGLTIAVPRSAFPAAGKDEFYWYDLIGLSVINLSGDTLGIIDHLLDSPAHDILVVSGDKERLIPFVRHIVLDVDLKTRCVRVDWGTDF